MEGMTVRDKVCLRVVSTCSSLSCDESQSFLVAEISREGILDNSIPKKERTAFRQIMGVQRKLLPPFANFQVPTAQNNM